MRIFLTTIILTTLVQPVFAGLFDKYPRGKKGDVIAEMRNKDTSKWKPDILFLVGRMKISISGIAKNTSI